MKIDSTRRLLRYALMGVSVAATCASSRFSFADEQPPKSSAKVTIVTAATDEDGPQSKQVEDEAPDLWLGIGLRDASEDLLEYLGIEHGVIVADVVASGPASKVDIRVGDILLTVDGKELSNSSSLIDILRKLPESKADAKPTPLTLRLLRKGQEVTVELTPEKRPEEQKRTKRRSFNIEQVLELDDKSPEDIKELLGKHLKDLGKDGERIFSFGIPSVMGSGSYSGKIQGDFEATVAKDVNGKRLEVSVQRKDSQPAKIIVKDGDKSTEYTEKQIDEIPEAAREIARSLLGSHSRVQLRNGRMEIRPDAKQAPKEGQQHDGDSPAPGRRGMGFRFFGGEPNSMFVVPENAEELRKLAEEMAKNAQRWNRDAASVPADVKELKEEVEALRKEIQELRTQLKATQPGSSGK